MGLKLYNLSDSPPCLMVRSALKYLNLEYEIIDVDFLNGEQFSKEYLEKNPQGEVPTLDDDGFILSESVAIIQYLADKYKKDDTFYPVDPQKRAVINSRLAFHLSTYYKSIVDYIILPACYAFPQTESNKKHVHNALATLETLLSPLTRRRLHHQEAAAAAAAPNNKYYYITGDSNLTIADIPLFIATTCLEIIDFDKEGKYQNVKSWYENYKAAHPELWVYGKICFDELGAFVRDPPDLSHLKHPKYPTDKRSLLKK